MDRADKFDVTFTLSALVIAHANAASSNRSLPLFTTTKKLSDRDVPKTLFSFLSTLSDKHFFLLQT